MNDGKHRQKMNNWLKLAEIIESDDFKDRWKKNHQGITFEFENSIVTQLHEQSDKFISLLSQAIKGSEPSNIGHFLYKELMTFISSLSFTLNNYNIPLPIVQAYYLSFIKVILQRFPSVPSEVIDILIKLTSTSTEVYYQAELMRRKEIEEEEFVKSIPIFELNNWTIAVHVFGNLSEYGAEKIGEKILDNLLNKDYSYLVVDIKALKGSFDLIKILTQIVSTGCRIMDIKNIFILSEAHKEPVSKEFAEDKNLIICDSIKEALKIVSNKKLNPMQNI